MSAFGVYWGDGGLLHIAERPGEPFVCGLPNTGRGPLAAGTVVAAPLCEGCTLWLSDHDTHP